MSNFAVENELVSSHSKIVYIIFPLRDAEKLYGPTTTLKTSKN